MTHADAARTLYVLASSGWAKRMFSEKQMQALRLGVWALEQVAAALRSGDHSAPPASAHE